MSRLARPLLLLALLLVADFALPRLLPGDPLAAPSAGGGQDSGSALAPEARARLLAYYGLDRPLPEQFGRFLLATARGDLGFSIAFNQPVGALIARRIGWTLFLIGGALALSTVVGGSSGCSRPGRAAGAWALRREGSGWHSCCRGYCPSSSPGWPSSSYSRSGGRSCPVAGRSHPSKPATARRSSVVRATPCATPPCRG